MRTSPNAPLPARLTAERLVAVLRSTEQIDWSRILGALIEEGISSLEFTLTTPGVFDALEGARARFGAEATIGLGSITTGQQVRAAIDAGAEFLVTPGVVVPAIEEAVASGVPIVGGAASPTEAMGTWYAGASAVKLFPASFLGVGYLRELTAPLPNIPFMPSGGVALHAIGAWLDAGAVAVSLGSALLGGKDTLEDVSGLRRRARTAREQVDSRGTS